MKTPLLLALLLLLGCSKEETNPLTGRWTIVETNVGTGTGFFKRTYHPQSEISLSFSPDGTLAISGPNPGKAGSELWQYNRYQVLPQNKIRLFNAIHADTVDAYFAADGQLSLWFAWARCGYEEKFVRF